MSDPVFAGGCGIRAQQTVWGEYGWPSLLPILAKPGTLLAATTHSGSDYAVAARRRGAATYAFDLKLSMKVGTPAAPADPSTIEAAAQAEYQRAVVRSGGCSTPLVVENELFGAKIPTPWAASTAQYRANVLAFLQDLAAQGAHPVLLVNKSPYAGSADAVAWWRSVAKVSDVVREVYLPATRIWPLGPILGNRLLRESYRTAAPTSPSLGIPANRLGIMISFLSHKGVGGRNGLEPASAWYQVVEVGRPLGEASGEGAGAGLGLLLGLAGVEQEGDGSRQAEGGLRLALGAQPSPLQRAADARDGLRPLADRRAARPPTRHRLPHGGHRCHRRRYPHLAHGLDRRPRRRAQRPVRAAHRVVGAPGLAARRACRAAGGDPGVVPWAAQRLSRRASPGARRRRHRARGARRRAPACRLEQQRPARRPQAGEVAAFYAAYPTCSSGASTSRRRRRGSRAPGSRSPRRHRSGCSRCHGGRRASRPCSGGSPSGRSVPRSRSGLPLPAARPAIVAALRGFERAQSFEQWTIGEQNQALNRTICLRDQLPQPAAIDLTEYLPFLRLQ